MCNKTVRKLLQRRKKIGIYFTALTRCPQLSEKLISLVGPRISNTHYRKAVSAQAILAITLGFLGTDDSLTNVVFIRVYSPSFANPYNTLYVHTALQSVRASTRPSQA